MTYTLGTIDRNRIPENCTFVLAESLRQGKQLFMVASPHTKVVYFLVSFSDGAATFEVLGEAIAFYNSL